MNSDSMAVTNHGNFMWLSLTRTGFRFSNEKAAVDARPEQEFRRRTRDRAVVPDY